MSKTARTSPAFGLSPASATKATPSRESATTPNGRTGANGPTQGLKDEATDVKAEDVRVRKRRLARERQRRHREKLRMLKKEKEEVLKTEKAATRDAVQSVEQHEEPRSSHADYAANGNTPEVRPGGPRLDQAVIAQMDAEVGDVSLNPEELKAEEDAAASGNMDEAASLRKRRLARERQRRRRKRIKWLSQHTDADGKSLMADHRNESLATVDGDMPSASHGEGEVAEVIGGMVPTPTDIEAGEQDFESPDRRARIPRSGVAMHTPMGRAGPAGLMAMSHASHLSNMRMTRAQKRAYEEEHSQQHSQHHVQQANHLPPMQKITPAQQHLPPVSPHTPASNMVPVALQQHSQHPAKVEMQVFNDPSLMKGMTTNGMMVTSTSPTTPPTPATGVGVPVTMTTVPVLPPHLMARNDNMVPTPGGEESTQDRKRRLARERQRRHRERLKKAAGLPIRRRVDTGEIMGRKLVTGNHNMTNVFNGGQEASNMALMYANAPQENTWANTTPQGMQLANTHPDRRWWNMSVNGQADNNTQTRMGPLVVPELVGWEVFGNEELAERAASNAVVAFENTVRGMSQEKKAYVVQHGVFKLIESEPSLRQLLLR